MGGNKPQRQFEQCLDTNHPQSFTSHDEAVLQQLVLEQRWADDDAAGDSPR